MLAGDDADLFGTLQHLQRSPHRGILRWIYFQVVISVGFDTRDASSELQILGAFWRV
jgi:hypothetical protein